MSVPDYFLHFPISPEHLLPAYIHSMHVNTVALMNVAIVSTWAYVHKDGRETFSVFCFRVSESQILLVRLLFLKEAVFSLASVPVPSSVLQVFLLLQLSASAYIS